MRTPGPRRFRASTGRLAAAFAAGALSVVLVLSLVQSTSLPSLLARPLVVPDTPGRFDAMVVLGSGANRNCLPDLHAIRRTTHAARLFRERRAPIVVFTGGINSQGPCASADVMAALAESLGVPAAAIVVERTSEDTWENATGVARILDPRKMRRVLLVTDSLHMRRAEACFRTVGFDVGRASVPTVDAYADGLDLLHDALHEVLGWSYYKLAGRV